MPYVRGIKDLIAQPLYDRMTVATSGTTSLAFFQTPIGQSSKTLLHTNMRLAGQVSAHQESLVIGIQVQPVIVDAHTLADLYGVFNGGYMVFTIQQKTFFESPLLFLPGGGGITGTTTANADIMATNAFPAVANMFHLSYPIKLSNGQTFDVTLYWGTAPTPGTAMELYVKLHGYMKRPVL